MSAKPQIRFGILSTASIARKYWEAILAAGHVVSVVGSRERAKAEKFTKELMTAFPFAAAPTVVDDYNGVINFQDVDVVYFPVPTGLRAEQVCIAARNKKHILAEKPCAVSVAQLKMMLQACHDNGVQFMDGVMLSHGKRLQHVLSAIHEKGEIGTLRYIHSHFSFLGDAEFLKNDIRVHRKTEPYGALGDIGWYCIRYTTHLMKDKLPTSVIGRVVKANEEGVPLEFSGELFYAEENVSATFFCSFLANWNTEITATGSDGYLTVRDFCLPFHGTSTKYTVAKHHNRKTKEGLQFPVDNFKEELVPEPSNFQEQQLIRDMADIVASKTLDPKWPALSLGTQRVMEALYASATEHQQRPVKLSDIDS